MCTSRGESRPTPGGYTTSYECRLHDSSRHERQRITYSHRAFAALKQLTHEDSIMDDMTIECKRGHNISQLAVKLSTWAMHISNKSKPDYWQLVSLILDSKTPSARPHPFRRSVLGE
jgi:hypothetical protein